MIALDYTLLYQVVLFLVLWLVLDRLLFRPYLGVLDERERRTAGTEHESADLVQEGERLKSEYQEKIAQADTAALAARESILREARQQREKILAEAREEANTTLSRVRQELRSQLEKERQLAIAEAALIAQEMASKILGRRL
jgi:F-type H+-transporting ATPase subunit b